MPSSWEQSLFAVLDDLEQQADGLHLDDRGHDVEALAAAEFGALTVESRWLAAVGEPVSVRLLGGLLVRGRVRRCGAGWVLLEDDVAHLWLCPAEAVAAVGGLGERSVAEGSRTVLSRLGIGSVLRRLAADRVDCLVHLRDGQRVEGLPLRVGRDFVELRGPAGDQLVVLGAVAAVQGRG